MKLAIFPRATPSLADPQLVDSAIEVLQGRTDLDVVVHGDVAVVQPGSPPRGLLGFEGSPRAKPEDRDRRLVEIREAAQGVTGGVDWQDPAWNVITAIANTDAVLLLGGGDASVLEPADAYELFGLIEIARIFAKPIALVGFQLTDPLLRHEGDIIAQALRAASLVNVVDHSSFDWAIRHGVPPARLRQSSLGIGLSSSLARAEAPDDSLPSAYIAADFGGLADLDFSAKAVTEVVEALSATTGLPAVLLETLLAEAVPRESGRGEAPGSPGSIIRVSVQSPQQAAAVMSRASLVLSTESMTLRLAARRAVPAIGIGADERSMFAVAGELERIGMTEWAVSAASLGSGDLTQLVEETWSRRTRIREHLQSIAEQDSAAVQRSWDEVVSILDGREASTSLSAHVQELRLRDRGLATRVTFARELSRWTRERHLAETLELRDLIDELAGTARELHRAETQIGELHAELLDAEFRAAESEAGLAAAHALTAELAEPLFARALRPPVVPYSENALNDLLQSRTMRWSTRLRAITGRLRRSAR